MTNSTKLILIKSFHTFVWAYNTVAIFLAFYFAFIGRFDTLFWIATILIFIETVILFIYDWKCPLTQIAAKYTQDRRANFDIYLPEKWAEYNVRISITLVVLGIVIALVKNLFY